MNADEWNAAAQMLLALGAGSAALASAYTYWKSQRLVAARWMVETFHLFYSDDDVSRGRELLEYGNDSVVAPLCELRVLDRHVELSRAERANLRDLDLILNLFEQLLYLQNEGHLLDKDRRVFFEYWFGLLAEPERAALRRYLRNCGYELCSDFLQLEEPEYLVAYGSLMRGLRGPHEDQAAADLTFVGPVTITGALYSRGEFPALVPGTDPIYAELFRIECREAFQKLDALEHYDARELPRSLYRRRCIRIPDTAIDAWIYYWNQPVEGLVAVEGDRWTR